MKKLLAIFGPAIPAAIFTALAWYSINRFVPHAGKGVLENQSWPLNNVYICAAAGSALMSAASVMQLMFSHHRRQSLEAAAAIAGLEFRGTIDRNELMYTGNLRVLDNWSRGTNSAIGKINGTSVQIVDVETTHTSRQTGLGHLGGDSTSRHYQTVYLLPADDVPFPSVSLVRRGGMQWASELLGFKGMEFYAEQCTASAQDQQTLTDFHNRYMVTQGPALKSSFGPQDADDEAALFQRLGEVIGLPLLRRLTEVGQWNLELCPSHVAIWKSGKLVKPNELPQQLNEVLELHRLLIEHGDHRVADSTCGPRLCKNADRIESYGIPAADGERLRGYVSGICVVHTNLFPVRRKVPVDCFRLASLQHWHHRIEHPNWGEGGQKDPEVNRLRIRLVFDTADFIEFTEPCILPTCPNPASNRICKTCEPSLTLRSPMNCRARTGQVV